MKVPGPGGHIDQLIRQTRAHHVALSQMADTKANMLLTVSGLIVPISATLVKYPELRWGAIVIITFSVATVCLAAYSAMPKLGNPRKRPPDAKLNPLFFGDFLALSYDEYIDLMEEVISEPSRVYETQMREVYTIGYYLAKRKYKYLRLGYLTFITGVVLSAVAGVAGFMYHNGIFG